ncbi:MAG: 2-oxoglutarate and iron-dependent oxygenase domain-containing protein [Pseudomonadota bacterium]
MSVDALHEIGSKAVSFDQIPVIDVGPLIDGSDPSRVASQLAEVCENIGFLYVRNHGVSQQLVDDTFRQTKEFFALPLDEKAKLGIELSGPTLRGYIPLYGENVDPKFSRDLKECFDFGFHGDQISPFFGPNLMPDHPVLFRQTVEDYYDAMLALSKKLVEGIALSLNLPAGYFAEKQRNPITIQRLLHYPPQQGKIDISELGAGAHTDYGFLTILNQDDAGGLQVQNREGVWVDAPPIPGTFVINVGDLVETLTNGRYVSTMHRVINTSGVERYSIPFFIDMDFDAVVEPVPTCPKPVSEKSYPPFVCGQHKYRRFLDSYAHLGVS